MICFEYQQILEAKRKVELAHFANIFLSLGENLIKCAILKLTGARRRT